MPYIEQYRRDLIEPHVDAVAMEVTSSGELNYAISTLIQRLVQSYGGPSYTTYNAMIGALECVKQELYRKAVAPYEDMKIEHNGDIEWSGVT